MIVAQDRNHVEVLMDEARSKGEYCFVFETAVHQQIVVDTTTDFRREESETENLFEELFGRLFQFDVFDTVSSCRVDYDMMRSILVWEWFRGAAAILEDKETAIGEDKESDILKD
jgi:hypothetical protein